MSAHSFRVLLIRLGKSLPFIITFLVSISYIESAWALATNSLAEFNGEVVLYKPISWFIASYFEYNIYILGLVVVISLAVETCIWNKLAILYLIVQLVEKEWLKHVVLDESVAHLLIAINILASLFLVYKGLKSANNL